MAKEGLTAYWNEDKKAGIRRRVAVVSLSSFCNEAVDMICQQVRGATPLTHAFGRNEIGINKKRLESSLLKTPLNPNVMSVLVVGYEPKSTEEYVRQFKSLSRKRIESVVLLENGTLETIRAGASKAVDMVQQASELRREPADYSDLIFGLKCGGSDTTSGVASNPAVGAATDIIISRGGTAIFSETTEIIGAEHILAKRAVSKEVGERIYEVAKRNEELAMSEGIDLIGTNPVPDNIKGGISTIEEKSLGAILKSGSSKIQGVLEYEEQPKGRGLYFMDSPSAAQAVLTALSAAGCQLILFSTGTGNPVGNPISPVLKITANPVTAKKLHEHIDVDISAILENKMTIQQAGKIVLEEAEKVVNGKLTKAEILRHDEYAPLPAGL
ncbi:MAG: UxaA family hydrolase [Conexivisphaerales archaeon]